MPTYFNDQAMEHKHTKTGHSDKEKRDICIKGMFQSENLFAWG